MGWFDEMRAAIDNAFDVALAEPEPGSPADLEVQQAPVLRREEVRRPAFLAHASARLLLRGAADHAEGMVRVLEGPRPELVLAPFPLARAALENAAVAAWVTEPLSGSHGVNGTIRGRRWLSYLVSSDMERRRRIHMLSGMTPESILLDVILAATDGHPDYPLVRNRAGDPQRVGEEDVPKRSEMQEHIGPRGRYGYYALSSVAHPTATGTLGALAAAMSGEDEAQMLRQTAAVAALAGLSEAASRIAALTGADAGPVVDMATLMVEQHEDDMRRMGMQPEGAPSDR